MQRAYEKIVLNITWRDREIACEQALLFGRVKLVSRERAGERRSREGRSRVLARLASLAQIGELARRLIVKQLNGSEEKPKYEIKEPNGIVLVMWRKEQKTVGQTAFVLDAPEEPRKTKDDMEGRLR